MAEKTPIPPLEAMEKHYGITAEMTGAARPWRRRKWRAAHAAAAECQLSGSAEALLVLVDAFLVRVHRPGLAPVSHQRVAAHLGPLSEDAARLWHAAIKSEYDRMLDDGYQTAHAIHFNWLLDRCRVFDIDDEYHWMGREERINHLGNAIRIASHVTGFGGRPLLAEIDPFRALAPDYPVRDRVLSTREVLVAAGVIKLDRAWMVRDEAEKQKIKRFMNVHAERADLAVEIVGSRYVTSLEHLESLMGQSASRVLSDGSL